MLAYINCILLQRSPFVTVLDQRFKAGFESAPAVPCSRQGKSMYFGLAEFPLTPLLFEGSMAVCELLQGGERFLDRAGKWSGVGRKKSLTALLKALKPLL